jgi:hypothetical protein
MNKPLLRATDFRSCDLRSVAIDPRDIAKRGVRKIEPCKCAMGFLKPKADMTVFGLV